MYQAIAHDNVFFDEFHDSMEMASRSLGADP